MRLFITALTCLFTHGTSTQDYYWVGGTGNWSDLSHWATESGGSIFHDALPGPGAEITNGELIANGTEDNLIEISCVDEGGVGTFIKETGEINVCYVSLKDNHAIGGATFTAMDSEEQTNVMGWNFETTIGVEEITPNVRIWPNPSNGVIFVDVPAEGMVSVFDITGNIVHQTNVNGVLQHLDLSHLDNGNYMLTVNTNDGRQAVKKFILQ